MEDLKVTIDLDDYEALIRDSERVNQALAYIDRCKYPCKNELLSILLGRNVEEPKDEGV